MLPPFISDAKDKHPTFIFTVGAECYRHSFLPLKTNSRHLIFTVKRSRMLQSFTSTANCKLPIFILQSIGAKFYGHSLLQTNSRHLFLLTNGAECYDHLLLLRKTNSRHLFLSSNRAESYRHVPIKTFTCTCLAFLKH